MAKEPKMKIGIGADTGDFEKGSAKVKKALKEIGVDANSTAGQMIASFGKATVALAGVVSVIKIVAKALKDLKDQNQVLADTWGRACEGMSAAFDTFKTSVVSLDFSNFFSNMGEAISLARQLYDAVDAMGEIGTAYNIALAQQLDKIDTLRLKMKDTSLSEQERVAAGQELLKIYKQLEKNPTRGLARVSDTTIDYYMQKMGVNMENRTDAQLAAMRKKYLEFFKWLGTEQGESFLSAAETIAKSGGLDSYWGKTALANARNAGLEENLRLAYAYSTKMGDKDREKLEQAVVAYYQQENKYAQETFKIRQQIQQIQNEGSAAAAKAADAAAKEAAEHQKSVEALAAEADQMLRVIADRDILTVTMPRVELPALNNKIELPVSLTIPPVEVNTFKSLIQTEFAGMTVEVGLELDSEKLNAIAQNTAEQLKSTIVGTFETLTEALGTLMGDLATGENGWEKFSNAAVSAFGDMAISIGKIAIEAGTATLGIKASLESLSTGGAMLAIAAGSALVLLGSAVKSGMSNIAAGNFSSSMGTYSSTSSSMVSDYEGRDVNVNVTGTLQADGDQLVAVINNTNKKNFYTS